MDHQIIVGTDLGHQIADKEVIGTADILKISTIYRRYFRYFPVSFPKILARTHEIYSRYFNEISTFFDILLKYRTFFNILLKDR